MTDNEKHASARGLADPAPTRGEAFLMPPKKTAAERQREYRDRLKAENPEKYQQLKERTAARALEYYRAKKRNLTDEQRRELRQLRLQRNINNQQLEQPNANVNNQEHIVNNQEHIVNNQVHICKPSDRVIKNLERKHKYQLQKIQDAVDTILKGYRSLQKRFFRQQQRLNKLDEKCDNLHAELISVKLPYTENINPDPIQNPNPDDITPLKRTEIFINEHLEDIKTPQKEAVKRTLLEHNVLKDSLKDKFSSSSNPTKKTLKDIVSCGIVKKYKMKTSLTQYLGLKSNLKKYKSNVQKTKKLIDTMKKFYTRDDVSRASAGKKECITRKKIKTQKRYLLADLKTLHKKFENEIGKISFSTFKKYRPYYVVRPNLKNLETCGCIKHSNMQFRATKLKSLGLVETDNLDDLISTTACDIHFKTCMYGECNTCADKYIQGNDNLTEMVTWHEWKNLEFEYGEPGNIKKTKKMTKFENEGSVQDLINAFNKDLASFKKHLYNVYHQYREYKYCLKNLKDTEVLIHIDFSENWTAKYFSEVQATHFIKTQITLHTGVYYLKDAEPVSFCSVSPDNRHNPEAIWAHLDQILKEIKSSHPNVIYIHFFSDGPTTQYRQKKNFYLFSRNIYDYGFVYGTWSFFEASHGKGAADGIGGAVKRSLDSKVAQGHDIPNAEKAFDILNTSETSIKIIYVPADKIRDLQPDTGTKLTPLKHTMKLHQLFTEKKFNVKYRELSCFCENEGRCECHNPNIFSFEDGSTDTENNTQYVLDEATGEMRPEEYIVDHEDNLMNVDEDEDATMNVDEYVNDDSIQRKLLKTKKRRIFDSEDENSESYSVHDTSEGSFCSNDSILDYGEEISDKEEIERDEEQEEEVVEDEVVDEVVEEEVVEEVLEEDEDEEGDEDVNCEQQIVDVGSYVLVKFQLEKRAKYYVGQVIEVIENNSYKVKFLRNKRHGKFAWPINDDISVVDKNDITSITPKLIHERRGIKTFDIANCNYVIG